MTESIAISHLDRTHMGYRLSSSFDAALPTLVLVNSFATSADLFRPQFSDPQWNGVANLLAIELFGHGQTRTASPQFTYWDSAIANLQVLRELNISKAFVLGTSQGGWVAARMAMLAPDRIQGILPLGTSMDFESQASRELGCWDGLSFTTPLIDSLSAPVVADWEPADEFCDALLAAGLGDTVDLEERAFWHQTLKTNYRGEEGRRRLRVCAINLRDRDGLHGRLDAICCPVLWMHGTEDHVYSIANAEATIKKFTKSPDAMVQVIQGGQHFLSASSPKEVNAAAAAFIKRWHSR